MILNKISTSIIKAFSPRFTYISKKALDQIESSHGKTFFQRALMYSKQARHIGKQGLIGAKKDLDEYYRLYNMQKLQKKQLTPEEQQTKAKIRQQMSKFKYIIFINILPFSPPLLIFFILTYPTKVPYYFCLDQLHQTHQLHSIQQQKKAIQAFKLKPLNPKTFSIQSSSLEELKMISMLLFGEYQDGVVGINKYFKDKPKQHFIHPYFSRRIAIGKIRKQYKKSISSHKQIASHSLQQFILWKYERIMKGEDLLVFKPILSPSVQAPQDKSKEEPKGQNK